MKTILVLTNFSDNALHAAEFSLVLARQARADILLYNTYYNHATMPAYATGLLAFEEMRLLKHESVNKLDKLAFTLRKRSGYSATGYNPQLIYEFGEGPIGSNIATLIKQRKVALIVIGGSTGSNANHFFFGNDSMSIVENANCPVLVIPPEMQQGRAIKKVTLATDYAPEDVYAIESLIQLSNVLDFEIEIVHVFLPGEQPDEANERLVKSYLNQVVSDSISYQEIGGTDLVKRLNKLCHQNGSDMLAVVHRKHNIFAKMFKRSVTEQALSDHSLPLIVFPSQLKGEVIVRAVENAYA